MTVIEALRCMGSYLQRKLKQASHCRFPCEDLDLNVVSTTRESSCNNDNNISDVYKMSIQYQKVDTYKIMEEKTLYTWAQMACEIGGFIGLVMGMSVISVVEVFAYICLNIIRRFM